MIHSLSGGVIHDTQFYDLVFVQIENSELKLWYKFNSTFFSPVTGQVAIVPFGPLLNETRAKILKVKYNVSEQVCPTKTKNLKEIINVLN